MKTKFLLVLVLLVSISINAQTKQWTLQECVNHAIENNITVKQGENSLLINEENIKAAKGAFLPSASANLGQGLGIGSGFDQVSNQRISNQTTHSFSYTVNVNQTIFNGFRNKNLRKQSILGLELSELDLAIIKDDISLNVVNAYLNILFNKENLIASKKQYDFTNKQLNQVKELVDAGIQPQANINDVLATLSNDLQKVTVAENNLNLAKLTLSQFLQVQFEGFDIQPINVNVPAEALLYDDIKPILDYAYNNRSEIKRAEKNIENAELSTEVSKSGFMPTVSLGYRLGSVWSEATQDASKQNFFSEIDGNKGHNFSLNASIPIFSRFQNKTNVAKAKIQEKNSHLDLERAKLNLEATIQRAFTDAKAAFRTYDAAKTSLEAQQLSFNNSEERYNIGAMNAFDLDQGRVRLFNAETSLINAKYDFVFKTKVLDFYLGKSITQ
jgi:outer membrane protein|tara:strand:- start:340 stop:1668 length:1329 start_codon:yes stop_codon:yes gene_type:complete